MASKTKSLLKRNVLYEGLTRTSTSRHRKARQIAISEDAVIPLPHLRSQAVLGKRNRKRELINTEDAESNLRLALAIG